MYLILACTENFAATVAINTDDALLLAKSELCYNASKMHVVCDNET